MRKWDYLVHRGVWTNPDLWQRWLNDMGEQGWELVQILADDNSSKHVFKRVRWVDSEQA